MDAMRGSQDGLAMDAGDVAAPLLEITIGEAVAEAARRWPQLPALVSLHEGVRWTFAELDERVSQLAAGLIRLGLKPGDRVAVWAPNGADWTLLQFATARAGLIFVTFNTAYRRVELEHVLNLSGARAIVTAPGFRDINYAEELAGIPAPDLQFRIWLGAVPPDGFIGFDDLFDIDVSPLAAATPTPRDPVNIQFTSGTTGRPKGVTLTHRNILNNGAAVGQRAGIEAGDRVCIPVPLYHCFGMVMGNLACVTHGATMVYPAAGFDAQASLAAIETERCTHAYGVPTMFIAMLAAPDFDSRDLSSLRGGIMAGATCPVEVMRRVIDRMHMRDVTIAYGMTETSPVSTQTFADDPLDMRVETVGRVLPHIEIKIVDEQGDTVRRGVQGELCTRGYSVMSGYWRDPEATAKAVDADGFMHSGDLATMDQHGFVKITGRAKDMIIRGGENISPREIEEYLHRHPAIVDVAVIGVPDDRFGERVCAWVVRTPGATLEAAEVMDFCRGQLAHFKVPAQVHFVDQLPMTASGKVQKYLMRQAMADEGSARPELVIDPEMAPLAEAFANPELPSITNSSPEIMRAMLAQMSPGGGPDMHNVVEFDLSGVPARDYWPVPSPKATILFFHGGGWVVGSVRDYDLFARTLAAQTGCRVVSVDYRLAPEHPFPAAVEDAWASLSSLEPTGPLFVAGDSAGGNLSAVLAQIARDHEAPALAGQILIYPSVAGDTDSAAMHAFDPPFMKRADIRAFYDLYVPDIRQRTDPRFAPARGRLGDLAPALVISAGADLLAAEAQDYARAMAKTGVEVWTHHQPGALHGYLTLAIGTTAASETLSRIRNFIDQQLTKAV